MRARAVSLILACLLLGAGSAAAKETLDPVAACVRDNLVRYASPDRAVVAQYLSLESACQARIEGQDQARVNVSPLPGSEGGGGGGSADPPSPEPGGTAAESSSTNASPTDVPRAPGRGKRAGDPPAAADTPPASTTPRTSALPVVRASLEQTGASGPAGPSHLLDGPTWLIALVGGLLGAAAVAAWMGVRRRPR